MTTERNTIADLIEQAMKTADRSMKWTAERAGMAYATLRRKMHGGADFTVSEIARIAKALGVPPAQLLPAEFHELAVAS